MNYYPFHIGDFRSGTVNMTRLERWIYRDMLDIYYDTETPLSNDMDVLCHELGVRSEEERTIVAYLLRFKFVKGDDGYRHNICEQVIHDYHKKAETAQTNGKLGGRPKKAKVTEEKPAGFQSGSDPVATGNPSQTGSEANQEPRTNNQEPEQSTHTESAPNEPDKSGTVASDDVLTPGLLSGALRRLGVQSTPANPLLLAWIEDGFSLAQCLAAVESARIYKPAPFQIPMRYLNTIIRNPPIPRARGSPHGYESAKDKSRRETNEALTGKKQNEQRPPIIDIN